MERWLTQRLSSSLGATPAAPTACARTSSSPSRTGLVGDAVATASGVDPDADPWSPQRAVWPLLEVVGECLDEPWLRSLAVHLGDARRRRPARPPVRHPPPPRRAVRPLRAPPPGDGARLGARRGDVPRGRWQAELWRRLRARLDEPSPAERLEPACERLRASPRSSPSRAHLALRPDAAPGRPPRTCCARSPPAARSTSSSSTRRPRCGTRSARRDAGRPPRRGHHRRARRQPPARLLGPGLARDAARARDARARRAPPPDRARRRHAARAHPGRRPRRPAAAGAAPGARRRPLDPTTAASRSTPATAAPARSRSCATRSSTCSRRTTRCSRAT